MAVFTPSYPLTFPTVVGVQTQRFSLVRTVAVSSSPFTGQDQIVQHEGEYWTTQIKFPPMLKNNASVILSFLDELSSASIIAIESLATLTVAAASSCKSNARTPEAAAKPTPAIAVIKSAIASFLLPLVRLVALLIL